MSSQEFALGTEVFPTKKCCFCLPLRMSLLILTYLNLASGVLGIISLLPIVPVDYPFVWLISSLQWALDYPGDLLVMPLFLDLGFRVLLLIGLHQNDPMKAYAYMVYSLTSIAVTLYVLIMLTTYITPLPVLLCMSVAISVLYEFCMYLLVRSFRQDLMMKEAARSSTLPVYKKRGSDTPGDQPQLLASPEPLGEGTTEISIDVK